MKPFLKIALAPLLLAPAVLCAQNTGARATPQTQQSAPAAISGAAALPGTSKNAGSPATGRARQRTGSQRRGTPRPAADSSVEVIGAASGTRQPGVIGLLNNGGQLPGISVLHNTLGIAPGTPITVRLQQTITSAQARNGDTVHAVLTQPLGKLPSGAPVDLTVVAAAQAGVVGSGGVLSLQITNINGEAVLSQVITANGKAGKTVLPDDAPALGYEAEFTQDTPLTLPAA